LIVPGFAQTAATFGPLSAALFSDDMGNKISSVIVIDMPGHGNSSYPTQPFAFGSLLIEHDSSVVLQALAALNAQNIRPTILMGHSLGGEILMLAQQQLVSQGSSLHDASGINGVILLAPSMPAPLPWNFDDSGGAAAFLSPYVQFEAYGLVADLPPPVWVIAFYTDATTGTVTAGAPSPADAVALHYTSLESGFLGLELLGLPPFFSSRPMIQNGLFSDVTTGVVAMSRDFLFLPSEERSLYSYLTNDDKFKFFTVIDDPSAVHSMHTFNPTPLLHPIKKVLNAAH
jgi:pimeloyl-ACP methyl ester carboxylesterase